MKTLNASIERQKIRISRNFAKCGLCPKEENIFIKKTGETSFLMSSLPLAQEIIKTSGMCGAHQHQKV